MANFVMRGFLRPRAAVEGALGRLERQVLERLWELGTDVSVRELQASFDGLAYTTLMTTLDRLFKKGLLSRRRRGRAFFYRPRHSPEQLRRQVAADVIDGLLGQDRESARPVISTFIDAVDERDHALLGELEALIRRKRRQGREP